MRHIPSQSQPMSAGQHVLTDFGMPHQEKRIANVLH